MGIRRGGDRRSPRRQGDRVTADYALRANPPYKEPGTALAGRVAIVTGASRGIQGGAGLRETQPRESQSCTNDRATSGAQQHSYSFPGAANPRSTLLPGPGKSPAFLPSSDGRQRPRRPGGSSVAAANEPPPLAREQPRVGAERPHGDRIGRDRVAHAARSRACARRASTSQRRATSHTNARNAARFAIRNGSPIPVPRLPRSRFSGCTERPSASSITK